MVLLDKTNRQLIAGIGKATGSNLDQNKRDDYEYRRNGVVNPFMMFEPLKARRHVKVMDQRTRKDFAQCIRELMDVHYPDAEKIILVLDNLKPILKVHFTKPLSLLKLGELPKNWNYVICQSIAVG